MNIAVQRPQHQLLRLRHIEAVQRRDHAEQRRKQARRRHAADASERRAERLFADTGQEQQRSARRQHDDQNGDPDRICAAQDHRHLNEPDAGQRIQQARQRHQALLPPDHDQQRRKHERKARQHRRAVIVWHGHDIWLSVVVHVQTDNDPRALTGVHIGIDGQVVDGFEPNALPFAGQDLDLELLLSDPAALGPVLCLAVVLLHVHNARDGKFPLPGRRRLAVSLRRTENRRP